MKSLFSLIIFIFINFHDLKAQNYHPNEIRNEIYNQLLDEIKKNNPSYINKLIWLDPSILTFENIDISSNGIKLSGPINRFDTPFCSFLPAVKCVDRLEINEFKLVKIYNKHIDAENVDFYGIYPPLDNWRNMILHALELSLLKEKEQVENKEVIIPIKHIYFKKEETVTEYSFYRFLIDHKFKIIEKEKIKFL